MPLNWTSRNVVKLKNQVHNQIFLTGRRARSSTINAQISAQLQISARFELAPLLRLKICNKRPLQISAPPTPRKMSFGTRFDIRDVYGLYDFLIKCDIVK